MAIGYGQACPKPSGQRLQAKDAARKLDERLLAEPLSPCAGKCITCGGAGWLQRTRYNVSKALLLCKGCHDKAGRHEVQVPTP